jgi:hypothetical protein
MSSKFSSPFFQKSPLQGAYSSGAGGMVTVSYDDVHQKFQDGLAANVAKAYAPKKDKCAKGAEYYFDKEGAKFPCNKDSKEPTVKKIKYNQSVTDQATKAEEEDNMDDINSTGDFLESEKKKDVAELKRIKKEKQKKSIESMNTYFRNEMEKQAYIESKK